MALVKGVNSLATVEEADEYFETRLDVAAWVEAPEPQKAAALVTATSVYNNLKWHGVAVSDTQECAFPRKMRYHDSMIGKNVEVEGTPDRALVGLYELAYHLLNNDGLMDETGSVKRLNISSIKLEEISSPNLLPAATLRQIRPLLKSAGASRAWWRRN